MPHVCLKMIEGRSEEVKKNFALKLSQLMQEELGCSEGSVSIDIQDFPANKWKAVYDVEIEARKDELFKNPSYYFEGDKLVKP